METRIKLKTIFFLISLTGLFVICYGEGPKYRHDTPRIQFEFDNVYKDIRTIRVGVNVLDSKTLAQFRAYIPTKKGELYYCSDCSNQWVCVSTGTAIYQFAGVSSRTASCN